MSDIPTGLTFVDPDDTPTTFRVALFAPPGYGKSVAAASAPAPILLVSADRPAAYAFARKHHGLKAAALREVRYQGPETLEAVYRYLKSPDGADIRSVIVDPVGNLYDNLRDVAPKAGDGDVDYSWVNAKLFGFVKSLRQFDVHVVLVAHEKLNDGKKGDGKIYPHFGGQTLINKVLGELDICAHIERVLKPVDGQEEPQQIWIGRLQPADGLVCKESTGSLGDRRIADLARWFEVAGDSLRPDESDVPFSDQYDPAKDAPQAAPAAPQEVAGPVDDPEDPLEAHGAADEPDEIAELEDEAFALASEVWAASTVAKKVRECRGNRAALVALIRAANQAIAVKEAKAA